MKLFNFPYVIKKEILDHLWINHIFFLSLCSKNTKNLIIRMQKYQLQKIERVNYCITGNNMWIIVKMVSSALEDDPMWLFRTPNEFRGRCKCCKEATTEEVRVNELGTPIDFFRPRTAQSNLHPKYSSDNVESIIETIHDHLYELLGDRTEYWLWSTFRGTQFLPSIRNIRMLDILEGDELASTKINEFLAQSSCLEYFSWDEPHQNDMRFEKNSKVYEVDTLNVSQSRFFATDVLKYFNGRHAFLSSASIQAPNVIQFLDAWRSGEKFRNLEVIIIDQCSNVSEIFYSIEFKELYSSVVYSFSRKQRFENSPRESCMFKTQMYMVRQSDGRVASVLFQPSKVSMGVWDMTESEFLEKFDPHRRVRY